MKTNNKSILVIIICLLIVMVPLTIFSVILKFNYKETKQNKENVVENINKEKYYEGKLYFYSDEVLLGTYECKSKECSYAKSFIDDSTYSIDYLVNEASETNIIYNRYIFILDNKLIYLYDIKNSKVIDTYNNVKNYNNAMNNTLMIVQNSDNKWGVLDFSSEEVKTIIDFKYDFIGLINELDEQSVLKNNYFVVKKDNQWLIIDNEDVNMSNFLSYEITSYNNVLISIKNENTYYLYDYNGQRVIDVNGFNYVSFTDKYINIVDKNNNLYVYDYGNDVTIGNNIKLNGNDYKNSFSSTYNASSNSIELIVEGTTYSFNL